MQIYCRTVKNIQKRKWGIDPARTIARNDSGKLSGSVHILILSILMVMFVVGGGYLYSVNRNAVQGYSLRTLEKEINTLKQENAELKITEVDLRSLYRIETAEEGLHMQKVESAVYLEERGPVALR